MVSVIIPAYNEGENIDLLYERVTAVLEKTGIAHELVFIDDGSRDDTFARAAALHERDPRVRAFSFSRNFGKEAAIFAGLAQAKGDCSVVIDSDLQQPPETMVEMVRLWREEGYEIVEGVKSQRGDEGTGGGLFARVFYKILCKLTGFDMADSSDYKLLDQSVVRVLLDLPERNTFFRGLTFWSGFKMTKVSYQVAPRVHGKSKWSFTGLVKYAISNITNFSSAPLSVITGTGCLLTVLGVVMAVQTLIRYLTGNAVEGFTTVILLQIVTLGAVLLALGVIGHYVAKIYDEVKGRPRYIIHKSADSVPKETGRE